MDIKRLLGMLSRERDNTVRARLRYVNTVTVEHIRNGKVLSVQKQKNLIVYTGMNWLCGIMGNAQAAPAAYIALTSNATAVALTDTTTTWNSYEYDTNGLSRALGTYAHTTDTDNFTLEYTWTCSADSQTVAKTGLFNASTKNNGTLFAAVVLSSSVTLMTNDQLKVTWTVDLGL